MTGLSHTPTINFYLNGEIQAEILEFPKEDRVTTALRVARALEDAFAAGITLGHLTTKEHAPKKRTKKAATAAERKD